MMEAYDMIELKLEEQEIRIINELLQTRVGFKNMQESEVVRNIILKIMEQLPKPIVDKEVKEVSDKKKSGDK